MDDCGDRTGFLHHPPRVPSWILFCIVPFMAAIPPWGAMSRQRWTTLLKGDTEKTNRALSLSGVFDECMWVIGNPLASTLAVISGLLAFSFTGMCVVIGALMSSRNFLPNRNRRRSWLVKPA